MGCIGVRAVSPMCSSRCGCGFFLPCCRARQNAEQRGTSGLTEISHLFPFRHRSVWRVVRGMHRGRLVSRHTGAGAEGRAGTGGRWSHTVGWVSLSGRVSGV